MYLKIHQIFVEVTFLVSCIFKRNKNLNFYTKIYFIFSSKKYNNYFSNCGKLELDKENVTLFNFFEALEYSSE